MTGGPCGGKSSSLAHFSAALRKSGYDVYTAPEVPTILINGGAEYPGLAGGEKLEEFESALVKLQMQVEDSFMQIAKSTGRPSVVVYDRALLDVPAYLTPELWEGILKQNGWTRESFMGRYDLVLHLVTAADGAEEFYTTENNAARTETPEQARALDAKMVDCWAGHPNHKVIKNSGGFDEKMAEATAHVLELVGASS